jgi:PAS domain S-box-containing protein
MTNVDGEQRVVLFNPMAETLFAWPAEQAIGRPLADFIPERFRAVHEEHVRRFGVTGVSDRQMGRQRALYATRRDGGEFPIEASISQTSGGGTKLYTVMLRDITERDHTAWSGDQSMTRVMIADDHAVVRDGLRQILERAGRFEVVAEAADGTQVLSLVRESAPQVLLLDLSMPGRNGLELIRLLRDQHPALRILVLTMHAEEQYIVRAFQAGAAGYLTKESAATELVSAIVKVANGETYVSMAIAEKIATSLQDHRGEAPHMRLSDRELEVYRRLVLGEPLTSIASALCVSAKTVSTYKMRLMEKMQLASDAALVRYAMRNHLFDSEEDL